MGVARLSRSALVAVALIMPSVARADWMTLRFGIDAPEALQKIPAITGVAPIDGRPLGEELYGSLEGYQNFVGRFTSRFFTARASFIFSAGKLFAIELAPMNISSNGALVHLVSEYGAPALAQSVNANIKEYVWRDETSKNIIILLAKDEGEPSIIYRPLLSPHSTGF